MKFILIVFLICAPGSVFAAAAAASSAAIIDEYRATEERHKVQCLEYAGEIARNEDEFLRRALAVKDPKGFAFKGYDVLRSAQKIREETLRCDAPDHNPETTPSITYFACVQDYIDRIKAWQEAGNKASDPCLLRAAYALIEGKTMLSPFEARRIVSMLQIGLYTPNSIEKYNSFKLPSLTTLKESQVLFPKTPGIRQGCKYPPRDSEKLADHFIGIILKNTLSRPEIPATGIMGPFTLSILFLAGHGNTPYSTDEYFPHGMHHGPVGQALHDEFHKNIMLTTNFRKFLCKVFTEKIIGLNPGLRIEPHATLAQLMKNYISYQKVMMKIVERTINLWNNKKEDEFKFWSTNIFELIHERLDAGTFLFEDDQSLSMLPHFLDTHRSYEPKKPSPIGKALSDYKKDHPEFGEEDWGTSGLGLPWLCKLIEEKDNLSSGYFTFITILYLEKEWVIDYYYSSFSLDSRGKKTSTIYLSLDGIEKETEFNKMHRNMFGPKFKTDSEDPLITINRAHFFWFSQNIIEIVVPRILSKIKELLGICVEGASKEEESGDKSCDNSLLLYTKGIRILPEDTLDDLESIFRGIVHGYESVFRSSGGLSEKIVLSTCIDAARSKLECLDLHGMKDKKILEIQHLVRILRSILMTAAKNVSPFPSSATGGGEAAAAAAASSAEA